jgi:urease accessory protein UreF
MIKKKQMSRSAQAVVLFECGDQSSDLKKNMQLAEVKSKEILVKIAELSERIEDAKAESRDASEIKIRFWERSRKKVDATSRALCKTNETISEMNELIQASIAFTCSSFHLASAMVQVMSIMVTDGFENTNGELIRLSKTGASFAEMILSDAKNYVEQRAADEARLRQQDEKIVEITQINAIQDQKIEKLMQNNGVLLDAVVKRVALIERRNIFLLVWMTVLTVAFAVSYFFFIY